MMIPTSYCTKNFQPVGSELPQNANILAFDARLWHFSHRLIWLMVVSNIHHLHLVCPHSVEMTQKNVYSERD